MAFGHIQAAELGAGIGIAGPLLQLRFHRFAQSLRLIALGQQLWAVAVVDQGRFGAISDAPVGFLPQQLRHAVVHHRVVGPAPVNRRMAAEQSAHVGVGRLHGAPFMAQQVDQQHIGLCHQRP